MFTGIIETIGIVKEVSASQTNTSFIIQSSITPELKVDESVAHDGVCLTVEEINGDIYRVTAIQETLNRTTLSTWITGKEINIERCLLPTTRLSGHWVQGHVDCTANCLSVSAMNGSWEYHFQFPKQFAHLIVEKGSVCINGTSLTCFNVSENSFTVAIIPFTYQHTTIKHVKADTVVNIEFDIIGKYVQRYKEVGIIG